MILSHNEIIKALKEGRIEIEPFEPSSVGACSVDLRLGYRFRRLKKLREGIFVEEGTRAEDLSTLLELKDGEGIEIAPKELVLGCTLERIRLSDDVCARIDGRSRFARLGLLVHVSSSLIQPGVNGVQILEIMNMAPFPICIKPGMRICQIIFEELRGRFSYEGIFKKQAGP